MILQYLSGCIYIFEITKMFLIRLQIPDIISTRDIINTKSTTNLMLDTCLKLLKIPVDVYYCISYYTTTYH